MVVGETNFQGLVKEYRLLLEEAEKAMERAYSPYSKYKVGACCLTTDGKMFSGSNLENSSFGASICAERVAIANAHAHGYGDKITAIAIITKNGDKPTQEITDSASCGICRQVIAEASKRSGIDITIIMSITDKSKIGIANISELLPLAFSF